MGSEGVLLTRAITGLQMWDVQRTPSLALLFCLTRQGFFFMINNGAYKRWKWICLRLFADDDHIRTERSAEAERQPETASSGQASNPNTQLSSWNTSTQQRPSLRTL